MCHLEAEVLYFFMKQHGYMDFSNAQSSMRLGLWNGTKLFALGASEYKQARINRAILAFHE